MLVGYARVSTQDQETDLQMDALHRAGVQKIYQEKTSSVGARPQLHLAMSEMQTGDVLVVYKMDRVSRSMKDLLHIVDRLNTSGLGLRSLTEPVDTSSSFGQISMHMLGAFAQFERSIIRERAIAGQVAARQRGVTWGGSPRAISKEDALELVAMKDTGLFGPKLLAEIFDISISTVWYTYWTHRKPDAKKLRHRGCPVIGHYL